jgi:hypothetical protein
MTKRILFLSIGAILTFILTLQARPGTRKIDVSKLPPIAAKSGVTYATDIKPIFDQSCVKCHSGEKPKGKLRLDTLENVLKGGSDGKVIEAGNSAASVLVHNIAHVGDEDDYMPPPNNKAGIGPLTKDQISLIRAWIEQGAK